MRAKFLIIILLLFCSCGIYKYEYQSDKMLIVSKKGNPIKHVYIGLEEWEFLAEFEAIENKPSKIFSLKNFSPEYFKCTSGCSFTFEIGKTYLISVSPKGDRAIQPVKIEVRQDGILVQVKE